MLAWWWIGHLNERDDPLTAAQTRRGAFLNSGTRDIGPDPDWDFQKGQHKFEKGYGEIADDNDHSSLYSSSKNMMGRAMSPVDPKRMQTFDSDAILAAAKGLPPQVTYRERNSETNTKDQQPKQRQRP